MPRVEEWLQYAQPDVLCMQETKMADAAFPTMTFNALGYESAHHGNGRWNGVAILSRVGLADPVAGFLGEKEDEITETRLLSATCGGVRVSSAYVPNGRSLDDSHYQFKLEWLDELHQLLEKSAPQDKIAVCGDFNVAPADIDVWDPKRFTGTHVSKPERDALKRLEAWGLVDVFRELYPQDKLFSYWDYRAGDFHNHRGMRIDLLLMTKPLADKATWAVVDRQARKGTLPSDHAPVLVDLDMSL